LNLRMKAEVKGFPLHAKARGDFPGYPKRFSVPDEYVDWKVEWNEYKPVEFTMESTLKHSKEKKDPKEIGDLDKRLTYEAPITLDKSGRPLNPRGRTGISGRGTLWNWGPNHAADPIVTKTDQDGHVYMVAIKRKDNGQWAIPGGMVDPGEKVSATLRREFEEEAGAVETEEEKKHLSELLNQLFSEKNSKRIYQGYVDDPRNTDNAWMETAAYHFHCPPELSKALTLKAGDDAAQVKWLKVDQDAEHYKNLFASHKSLVDLAVKGLNLKDTGVIQYHRLITINYLGEKRTFKFRDGNSFTDIRAAIQSSFRLSNETPLILMDSEGVDVVIDHTLPTGTYTLMTSQATN